MLRPGPPAWAEAMRWWTCVLLPLRSGTPWAVAAYCSAGEVDGPWACSSRAPAPSPRAAQDVRGSRSLSGPSARTRPWGRPRPARTSCVLAAPAAWVAGHLYLPSGCVLRSGHTDRVRRRTQREPSARASCVLTTRTAYASGRNGAVCAGVLRPHPSASRTVADAAGVRSVMSCRPVVRATCDAGGTTGCGDHRRSAPLEDRHVRRRRRGGPLRPWRACPGTAR